MGGLMSRCERSKILLQVAETQFWFCRMSCLAAWVALENVRVTAIAYRDNLIYVDGEKVGFTMPSWDVSQGG